MRARSAPADHVRALAHPPCNPPLLLCPSAPIDPFAMSHPANPATIKVSYAGLIRHLVPDVDETFALPAGSTVRDLLLAVAARHGEDVREMLFVGDRLLVPNAIILVDGTDIGQLRGLDTAVRPEGVTQVLVMNPATGGG